MVFLKSDVDLNGQDEVQEDVGSLHPNLLGESQAQQCFPKENSYHLIGFQGQQFEVAKFIYQAHNL